MGGGGRRKKSMKYLLSSKKKGQKNVNFLSLSMEKLNDANLTGSGVSRRG